MAQEEHLQGRDSVDAPKFLGGGDLGDASTLKQRTLSPQRPPQSGATSRPGTKRNIGQISEAGQPAEEKEMSRHAIYRQKKKVAQQEVEKERNDLKAENQELKRVIEQLMSDDVWLEKEALEGNINAMKLQSELKDAIVEEEEENPEKRSIQRELEIANKKLQTQTEVLEECFKLLSNVPGHGSQNGSLAPHVETNHGHRLLNEAAETSPEPSRRSSRAKRSDLVKQMLVDLIKEKQNLEKGAREMVSDYEHMKNRVQRLEKEIKDLNSKRDELMKTIQGQNDAISEMIADWLAQRSA